MSNEVDNLFQIGRQEDVNNSNSPNTSDINCNILKSVKNNIESSNNITNQVIANTNNEATRVPSSIPIYPTNTDNQTNPTNPSQDNNLIMNTTPTQNISNNTIISNNNDTSNHLSDLNLSNLLIIRNPNGEVAMGYTKNNKKRGISLEDQSISLNIVHQHYGTFIQQFSTINNEIPHQRISTINVEIEILKYVVIIFSIINSIYDYNNFYSFDTTAMVSKMRAKLLQLNDTQLYHILWSFLFAYFLIIGTFYLCFTLYIFTKNLTLLNLAKKVMFLLLIYQFLEVILQRFSLYLFMKRSLELQLTIINYSQNSQSANQSGEN